VGLFRKVAKKILGRQEAPAAPAAPAARAFTPPDPMTANTGAALSSIDCGAQELVERIGCGEPVVVVDVRTPQEREAERVPGSLHIPLDELEGRWRELESCDEVVCYCAMGGRSLKAAQLLRDRGLFNATSLEGGIGAWKEAGGPTEGG